MYMFINFLIGFGSGSSFVSLWQESCLATLKADLNTTPMGNNSDSWVLCSDGNLRHNKEEMHRITQTIQEGDIIVGNLSNNDIFH